MNRSMHVASGVFFLCFMALAGCSKSKTTETKMATVPLKMYGIDPSPMNLCPPNLELPTKVYKLYLNKDLDIRSAAVTKGVKAAMCDATTGKCDEDASPTDGTYNPVSDSPSRTRLDIDSHLTSPNQTAIIKIILVGGKIEFVDHNVVMAGDDKGKAMFCNLEYTKGDKSLKFLVYHHNDPDPSTGETFGSFNVGVIIKEVGPRGERFQLPIFLDPEVKNNG
jgi:hypothetical protein